MNRICAHQHKRRSCALPVGHNPNWPHASARCGGRTWLWIEDLGDTDQLKAQAEAAEIMRTHPKLPGFDK
jgi:hypothetical protein